MSAHLSLPALHEDSKNKATANELEAGEGATTEPDAADLDATELAVDEPDVVETESDAEDAIHDVCEYITCYELIS